MERNRKIVLFGILLNILCLYPLCAQKTGKAAPALKVTDLKCEYINEPLGMDVAAPQLSWRIESPRRGIRQQAYQVVVAETREELAREENVLWDSGRITGSRSAGVKYGGPGLTSRQKCYWKVRVWEDEASASEWSEPAFFEMGLLEEEDWLGEWIAYVPGLPGRVIYFKTTFSHQKEVSEARAYVAGLGFYEMYINNEKVGDRVLEPAQSTYTKRVYYSTYDITGQVAGEENVVLIPVAQGWYGTPKLRMQIEITYTDGTRNIITSNHMRSVAKGPIVNTSIFDGEIYDANQAVPDLYRAWVPAGLMNKEWGFAHFTEEPGGRMVSQKIEPIRVVETLLPAAVTEPEPGVYVIDAGRNLAGWAALEVEGEKGTVITLKFAESVYENGLVNQENLRYALATDTYIMSGNGTERWEPSFTYHGFRYVQIEGLPHRPGPETVKIRVVRSDVDVTGTFACSNPLLNDIHTMVFNTEAANLHSVPTDCPQRDERMGWMNDLTVRIEQAIYNFDMSRFYPKFLDDVEDTQKKDGSITCVAPFRFGASPADPVSASYLLLAWKCYEFYGDEQIIHDHYDGMKAWVDFLRSRTEDGIVNYSYYGDWSPPQEFAAAPYSAVSRDTPGKMISTGYLYYCATILSEMAAITGHTQDIALYSRLARETAEAFNREYWDGQTGGYATNNQASNSFALYMGLVAEENIPRVVGNLVENVKKYDYHLTTGNLCTKYLMEMLTEYGHHEVAYRIATQTTYPSWGYMLANGATTLWERWEFATGDDMNSHNHPMMGSVDSWFYRYVLGIRPDVRHPGFDRFVIRPYIFEDLDHALGEFKSIKGVIKSGWNKSGGRLNLDVTIPPNTVATVYVPAAPGAQVTEGGKRADRVQGLTFLRHEDGYAVYEAGSGSYSFSVRN